MPYLLVALIMNSKFSLSSSLTNFLIFFPFPVSRLSTHLPSLFSPTRIRNQHKSNPPPPLVISSPSQPFFIRPITGLITSKVYSVFLTPNFETHFNFLNSQILSSPNGGSKPYITGPHLTGADILLSFPLIAAKQRAGLTADKYPELFAYIERLEGEEAYKKAVVKIVEVEGSFSAV